MEKRGGRGIRGVNVEGGKEEEKEKRRLRCKRGGEEVGVEEEEQKRRITWRRSKIGGGDTYSNGSRIEELKEEWKDEEQQQR